MAAVVITRELLGPAQCDVATARDHLLAHPGWAARLDSPGPCHLAHVRDALDRL